MVSRQTVGPGDQVTFVGPSVKPSACWHLLGAWLVTLEPAQNFLGAFHASDSCADTSGLPDSCLSPSEAPRLDLLETPLPWRVVVCTDQTWTPTHERRQQGCLLLFLRSPPSSCTDPCFCSLQGSLRQNQAGGIVELPSREENRPDVFKCRHHIFRNLNGDLRH